MLRLFLTAAIVTIPLAIEPEPRRIPGTVLSTAGRLPPVTAVAELAGGRLLITSAADRRVLLLDPGSGTLTAVGAAGAGPGQYAQPGGLYPGPDATIQILDRGRPHALTVTRDGALAAGRTVAVPGLRIASDRDVDLQQLDANGRVYFVDPAGRLRSPETQTLVRYDPATRQKAQVAALRARESRVIPGGDGMTLSLTVLFSPADGWGVAPDGRVAIVRADPYRVEWIAPDGAVTQGPGIAFDRVPVTEQDRRAKLAVRGRGPSVGRLGETATDTTGLDNPFAATKPPFEPDDVLVSPEGHVWVLRSRPFDSQDVIYDVFDGRGRRTDRIRFPAGSRLVGFGPSMVYTRRAAADGGAVLAAHRSQ